MTTRPDTNGHPVEQGPQRAPLWSPYSASTPDPGDPALAGPQPAAGGAGPSTPTWDHAPADPALAPLAPRTDLALYAPDATADDQALSSAQLLRPRKRIPRSGWRAALYAASGGLVNPGESAADVARGELTDRVNQRLGGCYRIAALSLKGGVGKTSTTALLGSAFASLRGDRVIALDANPDRGNLAEKVPQETTATVRDLLTEAEHIRTAADVRAYTSQATSRLEVLASESDPEVSEAFNAADYRAAVDLLSRHYNILLTDCGTGLLHSALQAAVSVADSLLIVTSASIDGARSAQATVNWLQAHGHRDLVARSVTVINGVKPRRGSLDLDAVSRSFSRHTREVVQIPFDRHLEEGAEIDLDQLASRTRDALLTLAAVVADDFARPSRHHGINPRRTGWSFPSPRRTRRRAELSRWATGRSRDRTRLWS